MIRPISYRNALAVVALAAGAPRAHAEIKLAGVFNDHMVIQCEAPVRVWGWADAGAPVKVQLGDFDASTRAGADGAWLVELPAMVASFEPRELIATGGGETIRRSDVLIGEVWLLGGEANMAYGIGHDVTWALERRSVDFPAVRFARVPQQSRPEPAPDVAERMTWTPLISGSRDVANVSGVAYAFGVALRRARDVPVGVVCAAWSGTSGASWASRETLATLPACRALVARWDARVADWPAELERRKAEHGRKATAARDQGKKPPRLELDPPGVDRANPGGCYNAMLLPIARLGFRGALFYHGEHNSFGRWDTYRESFPALIGDWRRALGRDDLPFGIVSLAGWGPSARDTTPEEEAVRNNSSAYIRDVHFATHRAVAGTGLIVTADLGDADNIHPHRKREIGERAARWALASVYDEAIVHTAPRYRSMERRGSRIVLSFDLDPRIDPKGPWYLTCPITRNGAYRGFAVAGADRHWHPAQVRRLDREQALEVWSDQVAEPVAVRYAWAQNPDGNVIGVDHLPVAPFRTDDWDLPPAAPLDPDGRHGWVRQMRELQEAAEAQARARRRDEAQRLLDRLAATAGE